MIRIPFSRFGLVRFGAIGAVGASLLLGGEALAATPSSAAPSSATPSTVTPPTVTPSTARRRGNVWVMGMDRLTRTLNLTENQAKQIKAIYDGNQAERTARLQAVRSAREALEKATLAIPMSEPGIRSAAQTVGQAEADSALLEAKIRAQINALLNPDQQQKYAAYHDSGFGRGRSFPFRGNN